MTWSSETAFAHLYLPESTGSRKLLSFEYDVDSGEFRCMDGKVLRILPWRESVNYLTVQWSTELNEFTYVAGLSIAALKRSELGKVVISRLHGIARNFQSTHEAFQRLVQLHPEALVYHLHHPRFGEWIGATPELLFSRDGNTCHTMALAGTLLAHENADWSQKLLGEHEFVVQDVLAAFRELQVLNIIRSGPNERIAGALKHLETRFTFQSDATDDMLRKVLHPTSAICGYPRDSALKWIAENEQHERRLYCGLLSIVDTNSSYVFVNLRCAQIFENQFNLFAGVGLTAQSDVQEEWKETERKLDTIRSQFL